MKTLMMFTATWCIPCHAVKPIVEELEREREDIKVIFVDTGVDPQEAQRRGVRGVPTILVYDENGFEVSKLNGLVNKEQIEEALL